MPISRTPGRSAAATPKATSARGGTNGEIKRRDRPTPRARLRRRLRRRTRRSSLIDASDAAWGTGGTDAKPSRSVGTLLGCRRRW
eukprot:scaffold28332_cov31-Tisochrysis_lutea.AAC.10